MQTDKAMDNRTRKIAVFFQNKKDERTRHNMAIAAHMNAKQQHHRGQQAPLRMYANPARNTVALTASERATCEAAFTAFARRSDTLRSPQQLQSVMYTMGILISFAEAEIEFSHHLGMMTLPQFILCVQKKKQTQIRPVGGDASLHIAFTCVGGDIEAGTLLPRTFQASLDALGIPFKASAKADDAGDLLDLAEYEEAKVEDQTAKKKDDWENGDDDDENATPAANKEAINISRRLTENFVGALQSSRIHHVTSTFQEAKADFEPSEKFAGSVYGYYFSKGMFGMGYYRFPPGDVPSVCKKILNQAPIKTPEEEPLVMPPDEAFVSFVDLIPSPIIVDDPQIVTPKVNNERRATFVCFAAPSDGENDDEENDEDEENDDEENNDEENDDEENDDAPLSPLDIATPIEVSDESPHGHIEPLSNATEAGRTPVSLDTSKRVPSLKASTLFREMFIPDTPAPEPERPVVRKKSVHIRPVSNATETGRTPVPDTVPRRVPSLKAFTLYPTPETFPYTTPAQPEPERPLFRKKSVAFTRKASKKSSRHSEITLSKLLSPYDMEALKREKVLWDVFRKIILLALTHFHLKKKRSNIEEALDPETAADIRAKLRAKLEKEKLWVSWQKRCYDVEQGGHDGDQSATYSQLIDDLDAMMRDLGIGVEESDAVHPHTPLLADKITSFTTHPMEGGGNDEGHEDDEQHVAAAAQALADITPEETAIMYDTFAGFFDKFAIYRQRNNVGAFQIGGKIKRKYAAHGVDPKKVLPGAAILEGHVAAAKTGRTPSGPRLACYNMRGEKVTDHFTFLRDIEEMMAVKRQVRRGSRTEGLLTKERSSLKNLEPPCVDRSMSPKLPAGARLRTPLGHLVTPWPSVNYRHSPVVPASVPDGNYPTHSYIFGGACVRVANRTWETHEDEYDNAFGFLERTEEWPAGVRELLESALQAVPQRAKALVEDPPQRTVTATNPTVNPGGEATVRMAFDMLSRKQGRAPDVMFLHDNILVLPMETWKLSDASARIETMLTPTPPSTSTTPGPFSRVQSATPTCGGRRRCDMCDTPGPTEGAPRERPSRPQTSMNVRKPTTTAVPSSCPVPQHLMYKYSALRADQDAFRRRYHK